MPKGLVLVPANAVDAETLRQAADRALYAAKKAGRNRVEVTTGPHGADLGTALSGIRGRSASQSVILDFGYPDPVAAAMDASGETIARREPAVGGT